MAVATPHGGPQPADLERPGVLFAGIMAGSAAVVPFNLLPLLLGSAADKLDLDASQVGFLGAVYLAGSGGVNLGQVAWVRRVNWRVAVAASAAVACAGLLASNWAEGMASLGLCLLITGIGCGSIYGIMATLFGDTSDPPRYYGLKMGSELGLSAVVLLLFSSLLLGRVGFDGLTQAAVAVILVFCGAAWRLPARGVKGQTEGERAGEPSVWASVTLKLGLAATGLLGFFAAGSGVWIYVERFGSLKDFSADAIGLAAGLSVFASAAGGFAVAALGSRLSAGAYLSLAFGIYAGALLLMLGAEGFGAYVVGICAFGFAWQFGVSYMMGCLALADPVGRFTVLNSAALGLGGILGPSVLALFVVAGNFEPAFGAGMVMAGLSVIAVMVAARKREANP